MNLTYRCERTANDLIVHFRYPILKGLLCLSKFKIIIGLCRNSLQTFDLETTFLDTYF